MHIFLWKKYIDCFIEIGVYWNCLTGFEGIVLIVDSHTKTRLNRLRRSKWDNYIDSESISSKTLRKVLNKNNASSLKSVLDFVLVGKELNCRHFRRVIFLTETGSFRDKSLWKRAYPS